MMARLSLLWLLQALVLLVPLSHAILPTAEIQVRPQNGDAPYTLLASQASFGPLSPMPTKHSNANSNANSNGQILVLAPTSNPLLCENITSTSTIPSTSTSTSDGSFRFPPNSIAVVPRGECTYQRKAYIAEQLGASAVVVYNTLHSRYSINTTKHAGEKYPSYSVNDILWPQPKHDYDCDKGSAMIPTVDLSFTPLPYNAPHNDPLLSGDTHDNLCQLYSHDSLRHCASNKCLITKDYSEHEQNATHTQVCCAWDLHLWLYADTDMNDVTLHIPTVFLTMQQGDQLVATILTTTTTTSGLTSVDATGNTAQAALAIVTSRWRSQSYNYSSLLIWMLGVCVAALAAYWSAADYHKGIQTLLKRHRAATATVPSGNNGNGNGNTAGQQQQPLAQRNPMQEETLELEPIHALGFVVMASSSLFILFYFKIYNVVKVMYTFGCSNAVIQVITQPIVYKIMRRLGQPKRILFHTEDFGNVSNWDIGAAILGYAWGITWLYMALFVRHAETYTFFWVTQDILGTCMCILFLGLIQLNSIQVAAILLMVAFCYDIFFVFVTPYLFQQSIMIAVATSGGPPKADPLWCEKYPDDTNCQGGDPLPMLLTVPRLLDYQGGASLLGLGDIVLPGLLLSFAARLDAAKSLVSIVSGGRQAAGQCDEGKSCCSQSGGYYFIPLVVAYAVGLFMANVAVYVMNMGQPALLYLVPCTLGTMSFLGWRRQELRQLWEGPRVLKTADQIVYGRPAQQQQQQQSQSLSDPSNTSGNNADDDDDDQGDLEEFVDDEAGDVPLLSTKNTTSNNDTRNNSNN